MLSMIDYIKRAARGVRCGVPVRPTDGHTRYPLHDQMPIARGREQAYNARVIKPKTRGISMAKINQFPWLRVLVWALALGLIASIFKDWGAWDRLPINAAWRVLIVAAGGVIGWLMNLFFGMYIGMATNVIESMGIFTFSGEAPKKIENGFIFVVALVAAVLSYAFIG
jgi:hypothetical protein